ncbi:retrovirus-related pol polyprotein from transposon TNT 1-94 [Tanacetum coccineum]|uniref:Retrovirus-related pol polyprotein from transposon TNT 1-94 n=1 Tax=Tanacetum coccineum TaxID=301880 RepID=A0ABQ5FBA0_9ASTR
MSEAKPPIPPPFGASSSTPTQSGIDENLPQLLDSRGGSHVTSVPAFDKEDFTSWKVRFLVFLDGLEPYLLKTLEDGPFVPMSSLSTTKNLLPKRQNQWSNTESRLANQDKRLKSIIISCLPNDVMKSVIKCKTAKEMWNDLILAHEGPSDTRDTKIATLRLKFNVLNHLRVKKIDDLTNGKSEKGKIDKGKSKKGLIAESFNWDEESVSLEDEGTTRIRAFIAIVKDEPSVGKTDVRSGQWVDITIKKNEVIRFNLENESLKYEISELKKVIEKWTCSKVTLDQLLSKQIPGNIVKAIRGKDKRKENNHSKEVLFTKADVSTSEFAPTITSDSEDDSEIQEPLPPLPKLTGQIHLIKKSSNKVSQTYVIKKRTESKHLPVQNSCPDKNALPSTEQLLLTLMEKKSLNKLKGQSTSKSTPVRTARMSKTFGECKYCGSNKHHPDDYEFYPGCEICGSIAHEIDDCPKNLETAGNKGLLSSNQNLLKSGSQKEFICVNNVMCSLPKKILSQDYLKRSVWYLDSSYSRHMTGVKQYMHRYSKEPSPKVVFGDDSSGDTEGYGSVNFLFTKTQGTIFNDEVVLIAPRRMDVYIIDMSSFNKESNACFLAKASPRVNWLWHKRLSRLNFKNINHLAKNNLVSRFPSLTFSKDKNCLACEKGKHHRASFKTKRSFSINKSLHLLHMDLFGPIKS